MADKLTAGEIPYYKGPNSRVRKSRVATLDNDDIALTDITAWVVQWGTIASTTYNAHPTDRGTFVIPTLRLKVRNNLGEFSPGNSSGFLPLRTSHESTVVRVVVAVTFPATRTLLDFTGLMRAPEFDGHDYAFITLEHQLVKAQRRIFRTDDRVGGDTGLSVLFAS